MISVRRPRQIPPTDLVALQREVLTRGPEAALPQNLPDRWLRALVRDLMQALSNEDAPGDIAAGAVLLVTALALAQAGNTAPPGQTGTSIPEGRLVDCFASYRTALMEEVLARHTGIFTRQYSVADIFA
ncbi:hypothetical protein AYM40_37820 (plasmid) [Paraburkholderia phytofirmans OLGA172]|uniref:Uncharacterized protein n=1 Tax=Paraburkholderia phytofirmans OLGA172 TaxID=1417228 RepID=A0A167WSV9_9BURK|nr:hypothetical protein [Paraburkholderia phytofirmans]ANB78127.1 hypothetical protein AYM40_37820 [Paraburkholderia phytofirmans OLGA172]